MCSRGVCGGLAVKVRQADHLLIVLQQNAGPLVLLTSVQSGGFAHQGGTNRISLTVARQLAELDLFPPPRCF